MVTSEKPGNQRRSESSSSRRIDSRDEGEARTDVRPEPRRRSRGVKWLRILAVGAIVLLVLGLLLPNLLEPWATGQIRKELPGHTKIGDIQLAWWSPITAADIEVSPDANQPMLRVGQLTTDASLWSVLVSRRVERVDVADVTLDIRHRDGTTNLDRWLKELPQGQSESSTQLHVSVKNGGLRVFLHGNPQAEFELSEIDAEVDIADREYGVTVSGRNPRTRQSADASVKLRLEERTADVKANGIELASIESWFRRSEPASRLQGTVTAVGKVTWNDTGFEANVEQAVATGLDIDLPEFDVHQIKFASVEANGRFESSTDSVEDSVELDGKVLCDFGSIVAQKVHLKIPQATLDWKSIVAPLRGDCDIDIDLAKTTSALPWLIPVREDLQLTSGRAQVKIRGGTEAHERLTGEVSLSDVTARGGREELRWKQPVHLSVDIRRDQGLQIENLHLDSDFLVARLNGSLESGNGTMSGDLGKLHRELSRWLELPLNDVRGQLTGELHWELSGQQIVGHGELDVVDALVKKTNQTPWSDARVHVDWKSVAILPVSGPPSLQSADLTVLTSSQDRLEWRARQADAGLAWSGDALLKLEHLPRAVQTDGGTTVIEGTLRGRVEGTTVDDAVSLTNISATIDQLHIRGDSVLVREPTVIFRAAGDIHPDLGEANLDEFEFTSTTVAFGGKDLRVNWKDALSLKFSAATRADLSKLDRWIPASQSDRYRWQGEFVGNLDVELALSMAAVSWTGSVDNFAIRRVPLGGVAGGLINDLIWQETRLTSDGKLNFQFDTQLLAVDVGATSDAIDVSLAGEIRNVSTTPFAELDGEIGYDYQHLQPKVQLLLGPSLVMEGKGRQPVQIKGPILANMAEDPTTRPVVNSLLEASAAVDWQAASGYGVNVGAGELRAELSGAVVTFSPLDSPLAGGRIHAEPWIDLRTPPGRMFLKPGQIMKNVNITPDICRTWIRFAAPLLANATRAEGQLTAQLDHAELPLGNPELANAIGTLQIHEGRAGAGPLVREILTLASQVRGIVRKQPPNLQESKFDWVTLPPQKINFRLAEGAVYHERFEMRVKDIQLVTSGTVYTDQTINLVCEIPVQDEWLKSNRLLSPLRGTTLRVPIRGTLSEPNIDKRILGDLGRTMLRGTEDLLRDQLEKGLRDLFK